MLELPTVDVARDPLRGPDLLTRLGLRRFARWRYARLAIQLPILLLALFVVVDGLTGRQLAPRNVATTAVWLHYRGLLVLALLVAGNLFCAACPLMLTRGPARWFKRWTGREWRWPSALRSKGLALVLILAFFYAYEAFALWSSPWLTAWLVVGYFGAAWAVDALFPAGTFCRYVCPLGNFNFALASVAPTQIATVDPAVCDRCAHKPCLHGRVTDLSANEAAWRGPDGALRDAVDGPRRASFVPLEGVVAPNGAGASRAARPGCSCRSWPRTWTARSASTASAPARTTTWRCGCALPGARPCGTAGATAVGVGAAAGRPARLVGAPERLRHGAALLRDRRRDGRALDTRAAWLVLALMFASVTALGLAVTVGAAWLADLAGGARRGPWAAFDRWGYVVVVLGVGFWSAHYLFHFLTGALAIVPVFQHFFEYRGLAVDPNWRLAQLVPSRWLFPIGAGVVSAAAAIALVVTVRVALRDFGRRGVLAMWVMGLFVLP
jgi:hypothetical protein